MSVHSGNRMSPTGLWTAECHSRRSGGREVWDRRAGRLGVARARPWHLVCGPARQAWGDCPRGVSEGNFPAVAAVT